MPSWEDISATYGAAASRALPLQRIAVFLVAFLISWSISHQTHKSILETLAAVPLMDFFDVEDGVLSKALGADLLYSVLAVICCTILSRWIVRFLYYVIDRVTDAESKAQTLNVNWVATLDFGERLQALELYEIGMVEARSKLKSLSSINELSIGIALIFGVATFFGNVVDACVSLTAVLVACRSHKASLDTFLNDYYGNALIKAAIQGRQLPKIGVID